MKPVQFEEAVFPGGKIGIRRFQETDGPLLFEAVRETTEQLCACMTWCRPDYTIEHSENFVRRCRTDWENGERYNFVIFDSSDGTFLGAAGLNNINYRHLVANVGYWVRNTRIRTGVATAATLLIAEFGLHTLGLHRLEVLIASNNAASLRVAQKTGAKFEGVLRKRLILCGQAHDAFLYSFTNGKHENQIH